MGIYLSSPSTLIQNEVGEGDGQKFATGELQVNLFHYLLFINITHNLQLVDFIFILEGLA
jgi:hypothetical protein